jgi:hypothetical protein
MRNCAKKSGSNCRNLPDASRQITSGWRDSTVGATEWGDRDTQVGGRLNLKDSMWGERTPRVRPTVPRRSPRSAGVIPLAANCEGAGLDRVSPHRSWPGRDAARPYRQRRQAGALHTLRDSPDARIARQRVECGSLLPLSGSGWNGLPGRCRRPPAAPRSAGLRPPASGIWPPTSGIRHPASGIRYLASSSLLPPRFPLLLE